MSNINESTWLNLLGSKAVRVLIISVVVQISSAALAENDPRRIVLQVKGAALSAEVWGDGGQTIVALPGLGSDSAWFGLLAPRMAVAGYRFVALNPRGIDGSTGALDDLSLDLLASDVAEAIAELDVQSAHLVGWAFGNRLARATAANHPDSVRTITLLAAGGRVAPSIEVKFKMIVLFLFSDYFDNKLILLQKSVFFSPTSDAAKIVERVQPGTWTEALKAQRSAVLDAPLSKWWPGGDAPMLVVQGLDDKVAPPQNGRLLKEEFPDRVELVEIEEAGHMLLVEQPDKIAASITDYLRRH